MTSVQLQIRIHEEFNAWDAEFTDAFTRRRNAE